MSERPPNIVLISADDMGYGDPGVYGSTKIPTPNIDRIAQAGVRFDDMHSSAAVCTPSRYSMLTGRYCWRTWLTRSVLAGFGAPVIEPGEPTIASVLRSARYRSAMVGKWHLGLDWWTTGGTRLREIRRDGVGIDGFDVDYRRGCTGGPTDHCFDSWFGMAGSLDMPPYSFIEGCRPTEPLRREKSPYRSQQRTGLMAESWEDEQVDVTLAGRARAFIEAGAAGDDPFFLYLATSAPHRPCLPPDFIRGASYAGERGDMVALYDWVVGQVIESLEEGGVLADTLLVVTSDHGARTTTIDGRDWRHKANGDLRGQKGDIYEGGHRVPCVAMWPNGLSAGQECDTPLVQCDFLPTFAAAAGLACPAELAPDGRSFLDVLRGENTGRPDNPRGEEDPGRGPGASNGPLERGQRSIVHHSMDGMFAIRRGPWKLIDGAGSGGMSEPRRYAPEPGEPAVQLFNLENDLREQLNLAGSHPGLVAELSRELSGIRAGG